MWLDEFLLLWTKFRLQGNVCLTWTCSAGPCLCLCQLNPIMPVSQYHTLQGGVLQKATPGADMEPLSLRSWMLNTITVWHLAETKVCTLGRVYTRSASPRNRKDTGNVAQQHTQDTGESVRAETDSHSGGKDKDRKCEVRHEEKPTTWREELWVQQSWFPLNLLWKSSGAVCVRTRVNVMYYVQLFMSARWNVLSAICFLIPPTHPQRGDQSAECGVIRAYFLWDERWKGREGSFSFLSGVWELWRTLFQKHSVFRLAQIFLCCPKIDS